MTPVAERLLVVAGMAAFAAVVYVVVVVAGGALLHRPAPDLLLAVLATAAVAVGLEPVRRTLARRFAASPYDQLAGFAAGLANVVATDELAARMARLLAEGTGARRVEIRLGEAELLAARWPPAAGPVGASVVTRHEVVHGGERLGVIVRDTAEAAPSPVEQRLLDDLLASAGLALRTVGLTAQLRRNVADRTIQAARLRVARARVVTAADAARRRLERDIHDGAQQHLVALAVQLGLAATVARTDPDRARPLLADLREAVASALATLEDLSQGIYPAALAEAGIGAALTAAAGHSPVPVRVTDRTPRRYPLAHESAAYFGGLEAVQNAVKHAKAARVEVVLEERDATLHVEVRDDGGGFDPAAVPPGTGLTNIRDRAEALGGTMAVRARAPGTAVLLAIPLPGADDG